MKISFVVVAYNAAASLPSLFKDLLHQDYPHNLVEVLLVDSGSGDNTKAVMEDFARTSGFTVRILDNPKRWLAPGCNVALSVATGEAVIRLDAHAHIPPDFLSSSVAALAGRDIVGGAVLSTAPSNWREAVFRALDTSRFCGGAASFRNTGRAREVKSLAYELCRTSVYVKVGPYDERLQRTEDNDMHYRMRRAGFHLYFDPTIISWHTARKSLSGQLSQKWGNGVWIGRTLYIQPGCFEIHHLIPMLFTLVFVFLLFFALYRPLPLVCLCLFYLLFDLIFAAEAAKESPVGKIPVFLFTPFLFPLVHFTYGFGTIFGLMTPVGGSPHAMDSGPD
ncbi:MAG: glycosyltransferase [Clostridia bacterium]|nr:glycosyltransferase [Clostridia bacterium]